MLEISFNLKAVIYHKIRFYGELTNNSNILSQIAIPYISLSPLQTYSRQGDLNCRFKDGQRNTEFFPL